jgi:hypothetical protein
MGMCYYGGNPMDTIPDWTLHSPPGHRFQAYAWSFGDLNDDGYSDFISETPAPESITYIFMGGSMPDTAPAYTWNNFSTFGKEIVRDLNGDSHDDIIFEGANSRFYVYLGGDTLSRIPNYTLNFFAGCSALWYFSLGDINHDGYNDFAVIDDGCNNLWGTICIYLGHPWLNADPAITIEGRTGTLNLIGIRTATGIGDVNGDGIDEFAIGAYNTNFDGRRGRAIILKGDSTIHVSTDDPFILLPSSISLSAFPNPFNVETTIELRLSASIPQVNLQVFNTIGQLVHETKVIPQGGEATYRFDGQSFSSGIYFLRATANNQTISTKLLLLK